MTTKRSPRKPQTDELAELRARLDKQADDLATQRQTIADLQAQIAAAKAPLDEADLIHMKDEDEPDYFEVEEMDSDDLRQMYHGMKSKRDRALELLGYAYKDIKRQSKNECKMLDNIPNERYARAWAAFGVLVARGVLPAPILDVVGDEQAAGVCSDVLSIIGAIELAIEASTLDE